MLQKNKKSNNITDQGVGLCTALDLHPVLMVSGPNYGANLSIDCLYSGECTTVHPPPLENDYFNYDSKHLGDCYDHSVQAPPLPLLQYVLAFSFR